MTEVAAHPALSDFRIRLLSSDSHLKLISSLSQAVLSAGPAAHLDIEQPRQPELLQVQDGTRLQLRRRTLGRHLAVVSSES